MKKKIILTGGGTMGSVSPLLAIAEKYEAHYLVIGTKDGPEKKVIEDVGLEFISISNGKLRRYWDLNNLIDIFKIIKGFFQSLNIIYKYKPDLILTAGSFVAVPVVIAAYFFKVPSFIHQQDIVPGLANKIMSFFAKKITLTFPEQIVNFNHKKTVVTGNPIRSLKYDITVKPLVVITGGGLGAREFNNFLKEFIPIIAQKYEVHHILGKNNFNQKLNINNYVPYKFIKKGMIELLSQAEFIISRAGMSLITEAANFKKPLFLIPIPFSHQEKNVEFFAKYNAILFVKQGSKKIMERYLEKIMTNKELRYALGENLHNLFPQNAVDNYIELIENILDKENGYK